MISIEEIRAARERVAPVLLPTPVERSETLSRHAGRAVLLKPEHRQRTGSFKIRGAYNLIAQLEPGRPVVAASAGNHGQGVARAAALTGRAASIFMPSGASLPKVAACRADGADVRLDGETVEESITAARAHAEATGAVLVHPFDDERIVAGQGTIGLEIAEECGQDATVVVPVGGGGLIGGVAAALAAVRPECAVIGVQAAGAAAMRASLDAGRPVAIERAATIADGIAVKAPSQLTLELARRYLADVVTVTDDEISGALIVLLERAKAVVEPAGAAALAAVLAGKVPGAGPVVALLSGGNVDPILLIKLIEHGLSAAGRYLMLRVVLEDRPGALAALTRAVADLAVNVLEVEHHRVGIHLGVDKVEVVLTVETRDPEHREDTVRALRSAGFDVRA